VAVAHAILHEDPITIRELRPECQPTSENMCSMAMLKNVQERYQSAAEMAEDLTGSASTIGSVAPG